MFGSMQPLTACTLSTNSFGFFRALHSASNEELFELSRSFRRRGRREEAAAVSRVLYRRQEKNFNFAEQG
jgi:hypothetical protein